MKFTLIIYAMKAVTAVARAATWLLNRWTRRRAFNRAMQRLNDSTDVAIKQAAEVAASGFVEARFEAHAGWLDPENPVCPGCKYCAALAEMSEQEFEYKEQN